MIEQLKEKIKAYYVGDDINKILDYITNLKQDIENYVKITLHDRKEIERLQKEINKLTAESTEWESKYYDLQKENEELKQTLHNITINGVEEENTTVLDLIKEIKSLKRERQRLLYNLEKVCEERDEEE